MALNSPEIALFSIISLEIGKISEDLVLGDYRGILIDFILSSGRLCLFASAKPCVFYPLVPCFLVWFGLLFVIVWVWKSLVKTLYNIVI